LATGKYEGVNHSHLAELLWEREGLQVSRPTLRRILAEGGVHSPKPQHRRSKHRSRRERYPQEGMLLQIDASHHHWFGQELPRAALLAVIDDATGKVPAAHFQPTEDAGGYLTVLRRVVLKTGVPGAIYSDRHSIFWPTNGESLKEQLAGRRSPTQFGRAMAELGIQLIAAHSPQAKGRVERLWGTLQDRLVSELRLARIVGIEEANAFLPGFLTRFNKRFAVEAETPGVAYRPRLSAAQANDSLCFKHERVVHKDNIVRLDGMIFQILPGPHRLGYANATVTICHTRTRDIGEHTRMADILVAAVGKARMITADMVKPGATVIDVGTNREPDGLVGDVAFDEVKEVAGAITPVPGGVGPMTVAMLLVNTVTAAEALAEHR